MKKTQYIGYEQAKLTCTRILVECEFWLLVVECFEGGVTDDETKGEVDLSLEKDLWGVEVEEGKWLDDEEEEEEEEDEVGVVSLSAAFS